MPPDGIDSKAAVAIQSMAQQSSHARLVPSARPAILESAPTCDKYAIQNDPRLSESRAMSTAAMESGRRDI